MACWKFSCVVIPGIQGKILLRLWLATRIARKQYSLAVTDVIFNSLFLLAF